MSQHHGRAAWNEHAVAKYVVVVYDNDWAVHSMRRIQHIEWHASLQIFSPPAGNEKWRPRRALC